MASFDNASASVLVARALKHTKTSPYHYIPTEGVAITFIVLFGLATLIHAGQAIRFRMWWLFPTACFCGLLEVVGWSARLWSSINPNVLLPFEIQITATIIGPTPLLAANFMIFGTIIHRLGVQYSRLSPKLYTIIFCTGDIVSLAVQGFGGAKAAIAAGKGTDPEVGGHIMLGGICFQMLIISIYVCCAAEFFIRYLSNAPVRHEVSISNDDFSFDAPKKGQLTTKLSLMCGALAFSTVFLFIRAIYRTIELMDGWNGKIISNEVLFNVLDGAMIILAFYTLIIAHPGLLLVPEASPKEITDKYGRSPSPASLSDNSTMC